MRSATGQNSEHLTGSPGTWLNSPVSTAQIEIIDKNNGGFGHILVDDIVFLQCSQGTGQLDRLGSRLLRSQLVEQPT